MTATGVWHVRSATTGTSGTCHRAVTARQDLGGSYRETFTEQEGGSVIDSTMFSFLT